MALYILKSVPAQLYIRMYVCKCVPLYVRMYVHTCVWDHIFVNETNCHGGNVFIRVLSLEVLLFDIPYSGKLWRGF